ncbi:hypothetical protein CSUI_000520 [Cystoisospora suis]|uniref:Transmembrane protein n=1 Tax=Cystoisospora suis TaxID=483139 RepID=A0A2C6LFV8_9APIC|nr:hypothetical protein CSUI_000520 [Cystoisospora suis]
MVKRGRERSSILALLFVLLIGNGGFARGSQRPARAPSLEGLGTLAASPPQQPERRPGWSLDLIRLRLGFPTRAVRPPPRRHTWHSLGNPPPTPHKAHLAKNRVQSERPILRDLPQKQLAQLVPPR